MTTEIITLPVIGTLTATEVHAFVVVFIPTLLLFLTRARYMVRSEPWYALGGLFAAVVIGTTLLALPRFIT
jgi:uncharacterized membrane protein YdcZ (DUF606 family)